MSQSSGTVCSFEQSKYMFYNAFNAVYPIRPYRLDMSYRFVRHRAEDQDEYYPCSINQEWKFTREDDGYLSQLALFARFSHSKDKFHDNLISPLTWTLDSRKWDNEVYGMTIWLPDGTECRYDNRYLEYYWINRMQKQYNNVKHLLVVPYSASLNWTDGRLGLIDWVYDVDLYHILYPHKRVVVGYDDHVTIIEPDDKPPIYYGKGLSYIVQQLDNMIRKCSGIVIKYKMDLYHLAIDMLARPEMSDQLFKEYMENSLDKYTIDNYSPDKCSVESFHLSCTDIPEVSCMFRDIRDLLHKSDESNKSNIETVMIGWVKYLPDELVYKINRINQTDQYIAMNVVDLDNINCNTMPLRCLSDMFKGMLNEWINNVFNIESIIHHAEPPQEVLEQQDMVKKLIDSDGRYERLRTRESMKRPAREMFDKV